MDFNALTALADQILGSDPESDETLERIAQYAEGFAAWSAASKCESLPQDALVSLSEKHTKVILLAQALQLETVAELKSVRSRAKGILTYADYLPRRISMGINKKG